MSSKILIACATKYGSTYETGGFIRDKLNEAGYSAELSHAKDVDDVSGYDLIVIGSPVYMGKWLPEATDMIKRNLDGLKEKKTAIFTTGLSMNQDTPENRQKMEEAAAEVRADIDPVSEGIFAGKMDYKKLSISHKIMIKAVKAPDGDFRDWEKISEWTAELPKYL